MSLGHMLNQAYRFYILRVNLVPFKLNTNTNTKLVYLKRTCFSRTFLDSKEKLWDSQGLVLLDFDNFFYL